MDAEEYEALKDDFLGDEPFFSEEYFEKLARGEIDDDVIALVGPKLDEALAEHIAAADPSMDWVNPSNVDTLDADNFRFQLTQTDGYRKWLLEQFIANEAQRKMLADSKSRRKK